VQHSYDVLDRPGGFSRVRILAPLAHRDFRVLWSGMCVSLLGDGLFIVALAWQVYTLSGAPAALATVGIAMSVPTIGCLLIGGAVSDRFDRRRVMLTADALRALAVGGLAVLAATGALQLWHVLILAGIYGAATAFFDPSFDAIVPQLLPTEALAQANSLEQLMRPLALRMIGPALGGLVVQTVGAAGAFGLDAGSFLASGAALLAIRMRPAERTEPAGSIASDIGAGLRYVRRHRWLWVTFAGAALAYLLFIGPTEVLVPFIVKSEWHGGAGELGLVFAIGGLGSLACAIAVAQRRLPKREIVFIYSVWALATVAVAGYGLANALWGLMLASLVFNSLETIGTIAWATVKQRHVPADLLGRVSSLDWLISIGLLPVSFALTGPVSGAIGIRATLIGAGLLGGLITAGALLVPGVTRIRSGTVERKPRRGHSVGGHSVSSRPAASQRSG
jgi:DHA3 family tetracycline resistance protein-like MFS transporter